MTDSNKPRAKVIQDSVSVGGHRLTTMEVKFHRFVLAEFNTHRQFSRNSASSRAIPFRKQLDRVRTNPAIPVSFPAEQRGMQGGEELTGQDRADAIQEWLWARDSAADGAEALHDLGVHKSVVNRIIEPFMWHTVIVTATEWDNFFHQRCHPAAQPEIRVAAEAMEYAYNDSNPKVVPFGQWHLPYIDGEDYDAATSYLLDYINESDVTESGITAILKQVSAARCARVSYLTHDGVRSIEADLELYKRLVVREPGSDDPIHWSPLEHVATPAIWSDVQGNRVLGNFTGWHQLRHYNG